MRISLDLDERPYVMAQNRARWINHYYDCDVDVYQTNKGYHVESHLIAHRYALSPQRQLEVREHLGDDPFRISMDRERIEKGLEWDVLFHTKNGIKRVKIAQIRDNIYVELR